MLTHLDNLYLAVLGATDSTLLMSVANCHALKVSSIVVNNRGGRLTRAFLAWPGHRLHTNHIDGALEVGIHDHRYDLELRAIAGCALNTNYAPHDDRGALLNRWKFTSGQMEKPAVAKWDGLQRITPTCTFSLGEDWFRLPAETLHDIRCEGAAAWWVREGKARRDTTTLYTRAPIITQRDLYHRFDTVEEVREHVREFVALFQ